jgi:hypothetical protein
MELMGERGGGGGWKQDRIRNIPLLGLKKKKGNFVL